MEQMYNTREELIDILIYVDFVKLCNEIKYFPELNQICVEESITFSILYISISIKRQKKYINELKSCVEQIYMILYHIFTNDKSYFKGDSFYTKRNEMRMACSDLFERQYKQMINFQLYCIKGHMTDIILIC